MQIERILQEIKSKEFIAKHCLPEQKVQTCHIDDIKPDWRKQARENLWWESGNIQSEELFIMSMPARQSCTALEYKQFLLLHNILLSIGGCETCFPPLEEDMGAILERGRYYRGTSKMMRGTPNACHRNVCRLWEANHPNYDVRISTGYALSNDGIWRQHSWLVHRYRTAMQHRTQIVETTEKRAAYYGFEMTEAEAEEFCSNNL